MPTTDQTCCISGVCDFHNARNDRLTHLRNLLYEKVECAAVLLAEARGDAAWHDTAETIVALDRLDQTVRSAQRTAVELATTSGEQTWASVGNLLGISRQAAHERFRRESPYAKVGTDLHIAAEALVKDLDDAPRCRYCGSTEGLTTHGACDRCHADADATSR